MINTTQAVGLSDVDFIMTSRHRADSHQQPVTATFRGGKSIKIAPGEWQEVVEARYFAEFGTTGWRTPSQIGADEQAALAEAKQ